jgi:hypothetical protein
MLNGVSAIPLLVAVLAVWRVTHLFWGEDGPWDVFFRLRRLVGNGFFGTLLDCFNCLSMWVAAPVAWLLGRSWLERAFLWFALSGGAILLQRVTAEREEPNRPESQAGEASRGGNAPPRAIWREEPLETEPKKER